MRVIFRCYLQVTLQWLTSCIVHTFTLIVPPVLTGSPFEFRVLTVKALSSPTRGFLIPTPKTSVFAGSASLALLSCKRIKFTSHDQRTHIIAKVRNVSHNTQIIRVGHHILLKSRPCFYGVMWISLASSSGGMLKLLLAASNAALIFSRGLACADIKKQPPKAFPYRSASRRQCVRPYSIYQGVDSVSVFPAYGL